MSFKKGDIVIVKNYLTGDSFMGEFGEELICMRNGVKIFRVNEKMRKIKNQILSHSISTAISDLEIFCEGDY